MIYNSICYDYKQYWSNRLKSVKLDNNIYKQINQLSSYENKQKVPQCLTNDNNETFSNDSSKCEALADQFATTHTTRIPIST